MDRMATLGADLFLGLFGVFAAVHAVSPKEPATPPPKSDLLLEWPSEGRDLTCLFWVSVSLDGASLDLQLPSLSLAPRQGDTCRWDHSVDGRVTPGDALEMVAVFPYALSPPVVGLGDGPKSPLEREGSQLLWSGEVRTDG